MKLNSSPSLRAGGFESLWWLNLVSLNKDREADRHNTFCNPGLAWPWTCSKHLSAGRCVLFVGEKFLQGHCLKLPDLVSSQIRKVKQKLKLCHLYYLWLLPLCVCLAGICLTPSSLLYANSLRFLSNALPEVPYSGAIGGPWQLYLWHFSSWWWQNSMYAKELLFQILSVDLSLGSSFGVQCAHWCWLSQWSTAPRQDLSSEQVILYNVPFVVLCSVCLQNTHQ